MSLFACCALLFGCKKSDLFCSVDATTFAEEITNPAIQLVDVRTPAEYAEVTFWLHRFRKLDVTKQSHRKMLIDTFVNAIFLYDDKMLITFNYKDGTKTITFGEAKEAAEKAASGSDMTMMFGIVKLTNLAHGEFIIMGAFGSTMLARWLGIDPIITLVITVPLMFIIGVVLQTVLTPIAPP